MPVPFHAQSRREAAESWRLELNDLWERYKREPTARNKDRYLRTLKRFSKLVFERKL